ncbi:MAG: hypothetical protein ACYC27_20655 [Armatimonadota bacterium]
MKYRIFALLIILTVTPAAAQVIRDIQVPVPHNQNYRPVNELENPHHMQMPPAPKPLAPWQIILNKCKEDVFQGRSKDAAPVIASALYAVMKDKNASDSDRKNVCSLLMGNIPPELGFYGERIMTPFYELPVSEQKKIYKMVPHEWLFTQPGAHGGFLIMIGEYKKGLELLKLGAVKGEWDTARFFIMEKNLPVEMRLPTIRAWEKEALKGRKSYLLLTVLDFYRRSTRIDDFQKSFTPALNVIKRNPSALRDLAKICDRMKWKDGLNKIEAISPSILAPRNMQEALAVFDRALRENDRSEADSAIKMINKRFPVAYGYLSTYDRLRQMFRLGWQDMGYKLIRSQDRIIDLQIKQLLLRESAFDKKQLNFWMKKFIDRNYPDQTKSMITGAVSDSIDREPELAVAVLNNALRFYPEDPLLLNYLSKAYERAGYTNRVIDIALDSLNNSAEDGKWNSSILSTLWSSTQYTDYALEIRKRVWKIRNRLTEGDILNIAHRLEQDSRDPQEALKWLNAGLHKTPPPPAGLDLTHTSSLYNINAYELRLRCLVKLNRTAKIDSLLNEAKIRYPNYPFADHVRDLQASIKVEKESKIAMAKETEKRIAESTPPKIDPEDMLPYAFTMWIGRIIANPASGTSVDPDQMPEIKPGWRDGTQIAVDLFKYRIDELIPFVQWIQNIAPEGTYLVNKEGNSAIKAVLSGFNQMNEQSLGGAFYFAAILTAPDEADQAQLEESIKLHADDSWKNMSTEDKDKLILILNEHSLNQNALSALKNSESTEISKWAEKLVGKQDTETADVTQSGITGFFAGIVKACGAFISSAAKKAGEIFASAGNAVSNIIHDPKEEMRDQALNDLDKAETSTDKANALVYLANADQEETIKRIEKLMPQLLIIEGDGDPPAPLMTAARSVYTAVKEDRTLANRASKLLDQAAEFSPFSKANLANYNAMVHFWTGEYDQGLNYLFHSTYWEEIDFNGPIAALVCAEVPSKARLKIAEQLEWTIMETRPMPSRLIQSISNMDSFAEFREKSPEGMSMLANILTRYIRKTNTIIPREFIEKAEWRLYEVGKDEKMPDTVRKDWYELVAASYRKGIKGPGDAKALCMPLRRNFQNWEHDDFRNTETYRRLDKLAKSFGC